MAQKFRKKPVVIEAMQFTGIESAPAVINWVLDNDGTARYQEIPHRLAIDTLEGVMRADVGDWVIRGVKGEFYACKPDIFDATYEPAS